MRDAKGRAVARPTRSLWALALLCVSVSGCQAPPAGPAQAEVAAAAPPVGVAAPLSTPADVPRATVPGIADVGLRMSGCQHFGSNGFFRHEWAAGLVPPEYRMHSLPGGLGEFRLAVMSCEGLSVGNATFIANGTLAYFGIFVDAPSAVHAAFGNIFVHALYTDMPAVAEGLRAVGVPVHVAAFQFDAGAHAVHVDDRLVAEVQHVQPTPTGGNESLHSRIHWKLGDDFCWSDLESLREAYAVSETALFHGEGDGPRQLSGPLGETRVATTLAREAGTLTAPACSGDA